MTPPVGIPEFKARFQRNWPYTVDPAEGVTDGDITSALNDATLIFNPAMWEQGVELNTMFLELAAHFLVLNVQAAGGLGIQGGLDSSGDLGVVTNKSVGSVSLTMEFAEALKNDPVFGPLMRTPYGARYASMAYPRTRGHMAVVAGFNDTVPYGPVSV